MLKRPWTGTTLSHSCPSKGRVTWFRRGVGTSPDLGRRRPHSQTSPGDGRTSHRRGHGGSLGSLRVRVRGRVVSTSFTQFTPGQTGSSVKLGTVTVCPVVWGVDPSLRYRSQWDLVEEMVPRDPFPVGPLGSPGPARDRKGTPETSYTGAGSTRRVGVRHLTRPLPEGRERRGTYPLVPLLRRWGPQGGGVTVGPFGPLTRPGRDRRPDQVEPGSEAGWGCTSSPAVTSPRTDSTS